MMEISVNLIPYIIGLPYWDWSVEDINGEFFPEIVRKEFNDLPDDFLSEKETRESNLMRIKFSRRNDD